MTDGGTPVDARPRRGGQGAGQRVAGKALLAVLYRFAASWGPFPGLLREERTTRIAARCHDVAAQNEWRMPIPYLVLPAVLVPAVLPSQSVNPA